MNKRRKLTEEDVERLKHDAHDSDAWEYVTSVPASQSTRPSWYGRSKHLELAATYQVLSVLHRLGVEGNLTYAKPDSVDIAAVRQSGEAVTIDVKILTKTTTWSVDPFRAHKHHFIVFVCFPGDWENPDVTPDLYIWPSEALRTIVNRMKKKTISLPEIAAKHNATAAWDQLATKPAA